MKLFVMLFSLALPGLAWAQLAPGARATPPPNAMEAAAAFAVAQPDEGSPFFAEREAAKYVATQAARPQDREDALAEYPRSKGSTDSAGSMLKAFFTEMFASVDFRGLRQSRTTEKLTIEPPEFSLTDRREVEATYSLRNNTGKIIRLDFPTTQRMDIVTTDSSGQAIDRWSDDRAFQPEEGIVIINPKERIEYREKIPTRDMKASETYNIQADMIGYPDYISVKTVTPTP